MFARSVVHQIDRVEPNHFGHVLQRLQGQVAFAALDRSEVSPVDTERLGERLLTEADALTMGTEIAPDDALQISDSHAVDPRGLLLFGLNLTASFAAA